MRHLAAAQEDVEDNAAADIGPSRAQGRADLVADLESAVAHIVHDALDACR